MHLQQHRKAALAGLVRVINIQQIALAGIGIADMAVQAHTLALEMKGLDPVPADNVVAQHMLALSGNIRAIILAQGAAQGRPQVLRRVHGLAVQVDQAQPGQGEKTQPGLGQRVGQTPGKPARRSRPPATAHGSGPAHRTARH